VIWQRLSPKAQFIVQRLTEGYKWDEIGLALGKDKMAVQRYVRRWLAEVGCNRPIELVIAVEKEHDALIVSGKGRLTQTEAGFRYSSDNEKCCSKCVHYIGRSWQCRIVKGIAKPDGLCHMVRIYPKKES